MHSSPLTPAEPKSRPSWTSNLTAKHTEATELAAAGVPVRIDWQYAIMHDKFIVVDGVTVETGSFNFTSAAERLNAEYILIVRDDPQVAG